MSLPMSAGEDVMDQSAASFLQNSRRYPRRRLLGIKCHRGSLPHHPSDSKTHNGKMFSVGVLLLVVLQSTSGAAQQICASGNYGCAISAAGGIACFGSVPFAQSAIPASATWASLATGASGASGGMACGILTDGTM